MTKEIRQIMLLGCVFDSEAPAFKCQIKVLLFLSTPHRLISGELKLGLVIHKVQEASFCTALEFINIVHLSTTSMRATPELKLPTRNLVINIFSYQLSSTMVREMQL